MPESGMRLSTGSEPRIGASGPPRCWITRTRWPPASTSPKATSSWRTSSTLRPPPCRPQPDPAPLPSPLGLRLHHRLGLRQLETVVDDAYRNAAPA